MECESLRSAFEYIARAQKAFPHELIFRNHDAILSIKLSAFSEEQGLKAEDLDIDEYPEKGLVRREQYPWNHHEPDRFSEECLNFLNSEMAIIAPKLEVKISELPLLSIDTPNSSSPSEIKYVKQLGVFAKQDIPPGDQILEEKSLLTAISRLHDAYCDASTLR